MNVCLYTSLNQVCSSSRYISANNAFKSYNLVEGIYTFEHKPFPVMLFASVSFAVIDDKLDKNFLGLYMLPKNKRLLRKC